MSSVKNARGIDLIAYDQKGQRTRTFQVKSLSKRNNIPLGNDLSSLIVEYVVICRKVGSEKPELFVAKSSEVKKGAHKHQKGYWLPAPAYEKYGTDLASAIGKGLPR